MSIRDAQEMLKRMERDRLHQEAINKNKAVRMIKDGEPTSPAALADKWLGGGSFGQGAPTWKAYQRILDPGFTLRKDFQLDGKRLGRSVDMLRDRASQRMDQLDPSRVIQKQRLERGAAQGQDQAARESALRMKQLRERIGINRGAGELSAITGAGIRQRMGAAAREDLSSKLSALKGENVQDRMGQLQRQIGLDVMATKPQQWNVQQALAEKAREDQAIFNKWAAQMEAHSASKQGEAIAKSGKGGGLFSGIFG